MPPDQTPQAMARRPLKSRDTAWAIALSRWLINKQVSPDRISIYSMVFSLLAGLCLAVAFIPQGVASVVLLLAGALFIQLRLLCNLLDGMVAIEGGLSSPIGGVMNELPDRVSDIFILLGMTFAVAHMPLAQLIGSLVVVLAVLTAYIRALAGSLGAPQRFIGWMGKSQRMALVTITAIIATLVSEDWADSLFYAALCLLLVGGVQTCWVRTRAMLRDLQLRAQQVGDVGDEA